MSTGSTSGEQLRERFSAWLAAIPARDLAVIGEVLDEDWVYVDYTGHLHDREGYFHVIGDLIGDDHLTELLEFDSHEVVAGVALAWGRYISRGTMTHGVENIQDSRFTTVWRRRADGSWDAVSHQATNIGTPYTSQVQPVCAMSSVSRSEGVR